MSSILVNSQGQQFEQHPWRCPICKTNRQKLLGTRGGKFHRYGFGVESAIYECQLCGLLYPDPFPVPVNSKAIYEDPSSYFSLHNSERKISLNREILRKAAALLGRKPRVLDVGAGCGEALVAAGLEKMEIVGIESSPATINFALETLGVEIKELSIEAASLLWPQSFDTILLNAVLEHVLDPNSMIESASRLLKVNGILYVDVPNEPNLLTRVGNACQRALGSPAVYNLSPTWPPYHVYGFNPGALSTLLGAHGFQIISVNVSAPPCIKAGKNWSDKAGAFMANQLERVANLTGTASNFTVWALKKEQ